MKKSWWKSLQVKIVAWSFVPTVLILSIVAWTIFNSYQKVLEDQAIKQDSVLVQTKTGQYFAPVQELINTAILPIFMGIDSPNEAPLDVRIQNILGKTPGLDVFDGGIYFVDENGKVIKTQPEQPELVGQDWSDNPQFNYIKLHPNIGAITDLLSLGSSVEKIFCVTWAMLNTSSELKGAGYYCFLIYPVTQNAYYQKTGSLDLGPNFYIVDKNLQVIFSQAPSEIGKDISGKDYIQQLLKQGSLSGRFRIRNKDYLVSYIKISNETDSLSWIGINERSWSEIMQPSLAYRQLLSVLLALGVIVPMLVTAYGVRHITNPIQKLIHASEQVTAGQFKHLIEVKTGDEIETLADQFNLMSAKLDDSYSTLEKKVADRTRELAIMNSIISVASRSLDIQEILEEALNKTVEQLGFDAGAAFKLDTDPTAIVLVTQKGFEHKTALVLENIKPFMSQVSTAVQQSIVTTVEINNIQDEELRIQLTESDFHTLVYVPLSTKGRNLGHFILGKHAPNPCSPEEVSLLSSIGQQIGFAMENAHLYEQAEQTAILTERSRLARELHDAVTQTLFSANLIADVIPRIWKRNPEEGMQSLEELRQLTRGALAEMRTMLLEMRPEALERSDIKSLLTQLADAFIGRVRVPVSLDIQGDCEMTQDVKIVYYRVAQEALNNIAKHSGARNVELHLECMPEHFHLKIKDDGLGFDPNSITPDHLGIAIMRERASSIAASLQIESQQGQGTTVDLDWISAEKG